MTTERIILAERIRRLGFAKGVQVTLYGQTFNLLSDPIIVGEDHIFVDAQEQRSGRQRRLRIPLNIVRVAKQGLGAMFKPAQTAA